MKIKNINDSINYIMRENLDCRLLDSLDHSWENVEWYKAILKEILNLPEKPKRVIDIGSNLNQYGYLFANENIEYIGIDNATIFIGKPIISDKIKFISADYEDVKELFKNDVIISCLCVGYLIPIEKIKCKKLIINEISENGKATARVIK